MSRLPDYEPQLLIPGPYHFTVIAEPEVKKNENARWIQFQFKATDPAGHSRPFRDVFLPNEERYQNLLLAVGGIKDSKGRVHLDETVDIVGKSFEGEIIHVPDRKDQTKIRDKIANIQFEGTSTGDEDGDIPF